jgi:hypothetical protein
VKKGKGDAAQLQALEKELSNEKARVRGFFFVVHIYCVLNARSF